MSHTFHPSYSFSNIAYSIGTGVTGITDTTWATSASLTPSSGRIQLSGDDADIVINGQSVNETLQAIKDQLLIPTVVNRNSVLEKEFEELRVLGEEYQKKLEYYKEQMKVFNTLKSQDL